MAQWMKSEVAFGRHQETPIQEALAGLALQDAHSGSINPEIALFSRDDQYEKTILLLSPAAAKFRALMPGDWSVSDDHHNHEWAVLYSNGARPEDLGLKSPTR